MRTGECTNDLLNAHWPSHCETSAATATRAAWKQNGNSFDVIRTSSGRVSNQQVWMEWIHLGNVTKNRCPSAGHIEQIDSIGMRAAIAAWKYRMRRRFKTNGTDENSIALPYIAFGIHYFGRSALRFQQVQKKNNFRWHDSVWSYRSTRPFQFFNAISDEKRTLWNSTIPSIIKIEPDRRNRCSDAARKYFWYWIFQSRSSNWACFYYECHLICDRLRCS